MIPWQHRLVSQLSHDTMVTQTGVSPPHTSCEGGSVETLRLSSQREQETCLSKTSRVAALFLHTGLELRWTPLSPQNLPNLRLYIWMSLMASLNSCLGFSLLFGGSCCSEPVCNVELFFPSLQELASRLQGGRKKGRLTSECTCIRYLVKCT